MRAHCLRVIISCILGCSAEFCVIDDRVGLGREFDGIGGLSGGGATSRLLVNYEEPYRSQILDFLFKPNFGASLHILKVEIGGDAQTTDGTEPSHMHSKDEANFFRGYEWWLMKEAKKRNPNIKLIGLPWAFLGWVGKGTQWPYFFPNVTADYVVTWIYGAKQHHNLDIDYIGVCMLKLIVQIIRSVASGPLKHTIYILLARFNKYSVTPQEAEQTPGSIKYASLARTKFCSQQRKTNLQTFFFTKSCYLHKRITSTISWNLIASYYENLSFGGDGLMTAEEPWSGHYLVESPIWMTDHVKIMPGKKYYLKEIVILYIYIKYYKMILTDPTFQLKGSFAPLTDLQVWYSKLDFETKKDTLFQRSSPVKVYNGSFTLRLDVDEVYTITTVNTGQRGSYPEPPKSRPFPKNYSDDFTVDNPPFSEAPYFDQTGVFEYFRNSTDNGSHAFTLRQVVTERPVTWARDADQTISIIGDYSRADLDVSCAVLIETPITGGVFLAARVDQGGESVREAKGVFYWIYANGTYKVTNDIGGQRVLAEGLSGTREGVWYTLTLSVKGYFVTGLLNGYPLWKNAVVLEPKNGWAALGTLSFEYAQFDHFEVNAE
uniref:Galactocerebrosidase n=1 Tax=Sinocyclocheilus grahami TaxID=75366 RepID=A0A672T3T4_SINGR